MVALYGGGERKCIICCKNMMWNNFSLPGRTQLCGKSSEQSSSNLWKAVLLNKFVFFFLIAGPTRLTKIQRKFITVMYRSFTQSWPYPKTPLSLLFFSFHSFDARNMKQAAAMHVSSSFLIFLEAPRDVFT